MTDADATGAPAVAIRARGPEADAESLRRAYLDLLELALCDLTGESTHEVMWDQRKRGYKRELLGEPEFWRRAEGKDWPLSALSMVGLKRLRDLRRCVETIVADDVPGDLIEAGSWRGGASILIRATLSSLGADERTLWVADSFQGFPLPQPGDTSADQSVEGELSGTGYFAPSLEQVRSYFARFGLDRGVRFVPGFFEETMSTLRGGRWALIRLDADTYRATTVALEALYPGLGAGGFVVIDDYFHPYLPDSCRKAVDDFRERHGITEPIEPVDWSAGRWRRQHAPAHDDASAPLVPRGEASTPRRAGTPRSDGPMPSARELQLQDELEALRARLDEVEAELVNRRRSRRPTRRARA